MIEELGSDRRHRRPRPRPAGGHRVPAPCAPELARADHQPPRRQHRLADRRHRRGRDRLRHARHGPAARARHLLARLHGGAGRRHGLRLRHRAGELPRRRAHRRRRPAGASCDRALSPTARRVPWRRRPRPLRRRWRPASAWSPSSSSSRSPRRSIAPYDPILQNAEVRLAPPSLAHPFGTDNFGRDILSRVIWGTRIDLQIAVLGVVFPFVIGTTIGTIAGYFGGWSTPSSCGSSTSCSPSRSSC